MNPVIHRELREQSRTPLLFRMRLAAAGILLTTLAWGFLSPAESRQTPFGIPVASEGSLLFLQLHRALVLTILALAPALTADALARERREATLGLLGLTPLSPLSVALGKSAANAIRALTLWLAPLPILTVPLLLGGVSGIEVATVVLFQITLLAVGLAAGLAASTYAIEFRRALALAYLFEALLIPTVLFLTGFLTWVSYQLPWPWLPPHRGGTLMWLVNAPGIVFGNPLAQPYTDTLPEVLAKLGKPGQPVTLRVWAVGIGAFVAAAGVVVLSALQLVARRTSKAWNEAPTPPGLVTLQRKLATPVLFPGWLRQRQRQRLLRNPLMWLQHRTVAAALTRWGWLTVVIAIWIVSLGDLEFSMGSTLAPLFLLGGMVFSAAGGFRAERENGTLELLLVTPLSPGQLLQSRCLSHLREFVPPVLLQLFLVAYARGAFRRAGVDWTGWNWWLISSLLTLPWIGLWRGLRARHFITAVLSTSLWGLLIPMLLTVAVQSAMNPLFFETPARAGAAGLRFFMATRLDWGVLPAVLQTGIAVIASATVWRDLTSRQFALGAVSRA